MTSIDRRLPPGFLAEFAARGRAERADVGTEVAAAQVVLRRTAQRAVTAQIEILDALQAERTATSGYLVWPFVARLHDVSPAYAWRPQPSEVAEVLDVPVAELASPDAAGTGEMSFPSWPAPRVVPVRYLRGHKVWGLTLRILDRVIPRALAGDWPI